MWPNMILKASPCLKATKATKATKTMKAIAVFQGKLKGSHVSFKQDDPFSAVKVSGTTRNKAYGIMNAREK